MASLFRFAVLAGLAARPCLGSPWDDNGWQKYIRSPGSETVKPKLIFDGSVTGDVSNPNGLLDGSETTVFTRKSSSDDIPSLVVDFGQNVVGNLVIEFDGSTNSSDKFPEVQLVFSETHQYLGDKSDFSRSDNAAGVSHLALPKTHFVLTNYSHRRLPMESIK